MTSTTESYCCCLTYHPNGVCN